MERWQLDAVQFFGGLVAIAAGLFHLVPLVRGWMRRTARVVGTVVGSELRSATSGDFDSPPMPVAHAHVRYEVRGRSFLATTRYATTWDQPRIGARVAVLHCPNDPSDGEVESSWGRPVELVLFGAVVLVGIGLLGSFVLRSCA